MEGSDISKVAKRHRKNFLSNSKTGLQRHSYLIRKQVLEAKVRNTYKREYEPNLRNRNSECYCAPEVLESNLVYMEQRSMIYPRHMFDVEIEPGQSLPRPEPCLLLGNIVDFPNPNYHPVISASANTGNLDLRHFQSHNEGHIFHHNQYNNLQHHHPIANLDLAVDPPHISYSPYIIPSANGICSIPMNHGSAEQMPSSGNNRVFGAGSEEYNRATHFMDNTRGSCKRKNSEGIPGNYFNVNAPASSSSSSGMQWEEPFRVGHVVIDAPALTTDYRSGRGLSITEGSQRSVRSRSSGVGLHLDSNMAHHRNRVLQGNYMGRTVQSANNGWVQQLGSNGSDGAGSSWSYGPALPASHTGFLPSGRNANGGSAEHGNIGGHAYQDTTSNRPAFILCSSAHQQYHHHHPPIHTTRGGQSYSYHSQLLGPSYRHSATHHLQHGILNSSRDGLESGSRYQRPFPSGGERMNRPIRRVSHAHPEGSNAHVRMVSSEDIAILEYSGFYGVGNLIDQHRDMRLDIDDMSYEELLALEERIGDVKTGLSEESISKFLKTRTYVSASSSDQPADEDQDNGSCIICQVEYEDQEKVGKLDCGHEYHADCIKQWLLVKNVCPICKANALPEDKKEG